MSTMLSVGADYPSAESGYGLVCVSVIHDLLRFLKKDVLGTAAEHAAITS